MSKVKIALRIVINAAIIGDINAPIFIMGKPGSWAFTVTQANATNIKLPKRKKFIVASFSLTD